MISVGIIGQKPQEARDRMKEDVTGTVVGRVVIEERGGGGGEGGEGGGGRGGGGWGGVGGREYT